MNKKLREALSLKCKDMGLTDKALDELTELGQGDLNDDASDEDIANKADLLTPFAKVMQGEITRKMRKNAPSKPKPSDDEGEREGVDKGGDIPAWFAKYKADNDKALEALRTENEALKSEAAEEKRQADIKAKAKKLGIPSYLLKRMAFAPDADIEKELTSLKQDLVNNNLVPKERTHEQEASDAKAMVASAEAWAKSLPDKH